MLQVQNVTDRVNTVSALFLGLTSSCAACHDHKFDPISQKEFYALGAFFNNSQDPPFDDEESAFFPTITLPKDDQRDAATALLKQRSVVQSKLGTRRARSDLLDAWLAAPNARAVSEDRLVARFRFDEGKGDIVHNTAPGAQPAEYKTEGITPHWGELLKHWLSMRLAAPTELRLGQLGDFDTGDAFTVAGWFKPRVGRGTKKGTLIARTAMGEGNRGWEMVWDDGTAPDFPKLRRWPEGRLMINLAHDGANAISVRAPKVISRIEWSHLAFSYDGSGTAAGMRLFINGEPQQIEVLRDRLQGSIRTGVPLQLSHRTNGTGKNVENSPLVETAFQDLRIYARRLDDDEVRRTVDEDFVAELLTRPRGRWSTNDRHTLSTFYFDHIDHDAIALREQLAQLDAKLEEATKGGVPAFVMREHDQLPMAHVLERGEYQRLKQRVLADVPAFLPPLPAGVKHDRLAFARWLVSPEHPLMSRVTVNRMWQELFGTGLVSTPGDFGTVGARPSDAALLDWLAVDFRESGWDVKRFYKQVLMSATYRQSARATPALIERDPANRLLARGPRFRLDGEMIRDSALAAGGLLREQIGGPAVNIYQPPNLWEIMSMDGSNTRTHVPGKGDALYRRSLYTFWKRTAAPPAFTTFDAPARESCIIQRERTDTPLQALAALNAPDFLEAARHLAARAMHAVQDDARMDFMAARVLTQPLSERDRRVLRGTFERMRSEFTEQEARDYLRVGDSRPDTSLPVIDLAAWSVVASQLMNTDAALNK